MRAFLATVVVALAEPMKLLLWALLLVTLPSIAYALPFMPDVLSASSVAMRFVETGTDTACVNCEDLDPTNDLTLTLGGFSAEGSGGFGYASGFMSFTGYLPSARDVDLNIEYDLRVVTQLFNAPPEEIAIYPLPSVSYGTTVGYLLGGGPYGMPDTVILEDCCFGVVGGAVFHSAFTPPSIWDLSEMGGVIPFHGEVHWQGMPYTPEVTAVPEPTTLLLLSSGLMAAEWKRRTRRQYH